MERLESLTLNTGAGAAIDTKPVEEAGESEGDAPESAESSGVRWLWLWTRSRLTEAGLRGEADECEGEDKGTTAAPAAPSDPSTSKGTTQRRMEPTRTGDIRSGPSSMQTVNGNELQWSMTSRDESQWRCSRSYRALCPAFIRTIVRVEELIGVLRHGCGGGLSKEPLDSRRAGGEGYE